MDKQCLTFEKPLMSWAEPNQHGVRNQGCEGPCCTYSWNTLIIIGYKYNKHFNALHTDRYIQSGWHVVL